MSCSTIFPSAERECKARGPRKARRGLIPNHRILSGNRVEVEHAIAGVKRCRIVKDVFRLTQQGISDLVMEIACGLHNLRISIRHPLPTFDLLRFVSNA